MIFEPTMIAIAVICMSILHPSFVFGDAWKQADFRAAAQSQGGSEKAASLTTQYTPVPYEQRRY